ncbi:hypothetical protein KIH74_04240 [Kineosporia sp. J2-2]|uniref:Uncharacterized protein n=1 Tax=Kineosporia corallincola TaxID=2835133 RepID=A0ABS5TAM1_9ACTN|nr:hypothetical protein [Kineosporia corallincola]MBT0768117.1 hypothetical protein [Kineosporia corallincola]
MTDPQARASSRPAYDRTTCLVTENGDKRFGFIIDGREYPDRAGYDQARREAVRELHRRRVIAEFITETIGPAELPRELPSWNDFRRTIDSRFPVPEENTR